ncbi:retrovirus-related Pol polyprotein from transposon 297 [Trichonephila clavipes]|nr:retrovirus-related Pol polyprotein from transposon 297 [Trichonephila clavipes]
MFAPSSFADPTILAHFDVSRDVPPRGGTSQWRPTRSSPGESPRLVPNIRIRVSTKYRHGLRTAESSILSKAFPPIQNRKYLEARFYVSQKRKNEEPTDFVYDLLKLQKKLELGMSEKALVDHIFVRLEAQVQDYVEINKVVKTVEIDKVEIDLSKTKLKEKQKRELQDLFDSFQGLFSDKPEFTNVLYHEIDTRFNNEHIPYGDNVCALDLRSRYFQMAVNPKDIVKTAFVTKNGTYAFRRMQFGLLRAALNFQKAIDIILKSVIGNFVEVYIDDVIISCPSFTQHVEHIKEVFRLLYEARLTLNKDKCKYGCEELKYYSLIINKEEIKTDETKVQAIVEMKPPRNSKEVSKFLGMSQRYAKFIKKYADICEPLYNLKRKLKKFIWSIEAQKAFDAVKVAITKTQVLKSPDFEKPFELFTDASSIGVGAVLNQKQRPVVFASRTLSAAERNYTVTERVRECLAEFGL